MTPPPITKATEAKLLDALEKIGELVAAGKTPTEATTKVAAEQDISAGHVRLLAQAYNTGRTNAQRKSASSVLERAANFPLVDAAEVIHSLYPSQPKTAGVRLHETAVSADYARDPRTLLEPPLPEVNFVVKAASTREPSRDDQTETLLSASVTAKQAVEKRRQEAAEWEQKQAQALDDLVLYFRRLDRIPYQAVRKQAEAMLGREGTAVLDKAAGVWPHMTKQAGTVDTVNWQAAPYSLITKYLQAARLCKEARAAQHKLEDQLGTGIMQAAGKLFPKSAAKNYDQSLLAGTPVRTKQSFAGLGQVLQAVGMSTAGKALMERGIGAAPKSTVSLRDETLQDISDPLHEAKVDNARRQFLLSNLLANDPVLSGHDPEEVIDAYNQVTQLAPSASTQPMLVRALLRRHLAQGQIDTHDVDQLSGIESRLREQQALPDPRRILGGAGLSTQSGAAPASSPPEK